MTVAVRKKRILRKFKLSEISPVDKPAQGPALALLMKRAEDTGDDLDKVTFKEALEQMLLERKVYEALDGMWDLNEALRISVREIVEDSNTYPDPVSAVRQSLADFTAAVTSLVGEAVDVIDEDLTAEKQENPTKTEGGKKFLASDFASAPDPLKPSIWKLRLTSTPGGEPNPMLVETAAAALGSTFTWDSSVIPEETFSGVVAKVRDAWVQVYSTTTSGDLPEVLKTQESPMTKKAGEEPKIEDVQADLAKRDAELAISKAYGGFNDAEKAHYNSLDEDGQKAFIAKSDDERVAIIKNLADQNPVIFTSEDGEDFRKNDDPRLVRIAKRGDEDRKLAKKEREERQNLELSKRASEEFGHLPGEDSTKVAMLKAVDGIDNEDVRKKAMEMLKASDAGIAKAMESRGSSAGGNSNATDELDTLAKRHMESNSELSYAQSYDAVLKTDEGKRLYNETSA